MKEILMMEMNRRAPVETATSRLTAGLANTRSRYMCRHKRERNRESERERRELGGEIINNTHAPLPATIMIYNTMIGTSKNESLT